jgi:hypothetical protein
LPGVVEQHGIGHASPQRQVVAAQHAVGDRRKPALELLQGFILDDNGLFGCGFNNLVRRHGGSAAACHRAPRVQDADAVRHEFER